MLPYGLQKRVSWAGPSLKPDLLISTNRWPGSTWEETEDMARFVLDVNEDPRWKITCLLVEHDSGVVMDLSHRIVGAQLRQHDPWDGTRSFRTILK